MAAYYLDTSALVKRYARELGSAWVTSLTDPTVGNDSFTVRLTGPELIAALFRKVRSGEISLSEAARAAANFRADWQLQYQILEVSEVVADRAMALVERHGLRGYDAVHLAAAVESQQLRRGMPLPPLTFVSADQRQLQAAGIEGLAVDDPTTHT